MAHQQRCCIERGRLALSAWAWHMIGQTLTMTSTRLAPSAAAATAASALFTMRPTSAGPPESMRRATTVGTPAYRMVKGVHGHTCCVRSGAAHSWSWAHCTAHGPVPTVKRAPAVPNAKVCAYRTVTAHMVTLD